MNRRMAKEARQLFWPAATLTAAGAMALVLPQGWQPAWMPAHAAEIVFVLLVFLGIPLLAGMPIGYEFQYGTLPGLLAAPLDRGKIWSGKIAATAAVVLAPIILFALMARHNSPMPGFGEVGSAWMVAVTAAAMYWTLLAGSTIGGLALNVSVQLLLFAGWSYAETRLRLYGYYSRGVEAAVTVLFLCYAVAMVWLGRRALLRYQTVEGWSSADPLAAMASRALPASVAGWFRCRPKGVTLNLLRRELRLLRPVWPLAILNGLAWTCLFALGTDPGYHPLLHPQALLIVASLAAAMALSPLIAILAGTLSLGEEKNFGTHSWHMTLPASARLQWFVKLAVSIVTAVLFAGALPPLALVARGMMSGAPFKFISPEAVWLWPAVFGSLAAVAFWLSSVVKGTVRAALWVFPALFLFGTTYSLAFDSGYRFAAWTQTLTDHILLWLDPFKLVHLPFPFPPFWESYRPGFILVGLPIIAVAFPAAALVLAQSYRKFRAQAQDTNRRLAKNLFMVAAVVFVCGIALGDFGGLIERSQTQVFHFFVETNVAIVKLEEANPLEAGSRPVRLSAAQLEQAAPLSKTTRRWLGNGSITISAAPADLMAAEKLLGPHRFGYWSQRLAAERPFLAYIASVQLSNGLTCRIYYRYGRQILPQGGGIGLAMFGCQ